MKPCQEMNFLPGTLPQMPARRVGEKELEKNGLRLACWHRQVRLVSSLLPQKTLDLIRSNQDILNQGTTLATDDFSFPNQMRRISEAKARPYDGLLSLSGALR